MTVAALQVPPPSSDLRIGRQIWKHRSVPAAVLADRILKYVIKSVWSRPRQQQQPSGEGSYIKNILKVSHSSILSRNSRSRPNQIIV